MAQTFGGRWRVIEDLGTGGQAFVHLVEDISDQPGRVYVIKRLRNPRRLDRFREEVATLKELDRPGITRILDFNLDDERPWFVQEFCPGGDLDEYVSTGKLQDPSRAFEFFIGLCEALEYAHSKSRVHRDLKPANVFLRGENGPVVIGDFGLAFALDGVNERITLTEEQVGSRFYMAPELRDGRLQVPTTACDIYLLGKIFYFMLSGGKVFDRENFKDERWEIVGITGNKYLEHANRLLEKMIVYESDKRLSASELGLKGGQAMSVYDGHFPDLESNQDWACNFCGLGNYKQVANNLGEYTNFFGFTVPGLTEEAEGLRALACDHCGHIQMFKVHSGTENWWHPR